MLAARATSSPVTAQDLPASCDRADPATCLYTSDRAYDVGEIDGVQLTDTARANYDLLLVIRYPVGAPGPRPVVIWHHGGNPSASRATRGEEWSRNLAAAGYVVVHPSRTMIADPTPFGAECRDNGFKVPRRMHILGDAEPHALRADPIAVAELARLLGNADGAAGEVVQHAFPRLFHAFVLDPDEPVRVFKPLYATLLILIAMADTLSHDDLELARVLVAALLNVGVDEQEYRSLVLDLEEVLERQRSLATFDWALDAAEVLAVNPAPQEEVRLSFIMKVLGIARSLAHRLGVAQVEALRLLCQDIASSFRPNCPRR